MEFQFSKSFTEGFYQGLKKFRYLAIIIVFWAILAALGVLPPLIRENGNLIIQVVIFILGIPTSVIFRVDRLAEFLVKFGIQNIYVIILIAGGIAALNFGVLYGVRQVYKDFFRVKSDITNKSV